MRRRAPWALAAALALAGAVVATVVTLAAVEVVGRRELASAVRRFGPSPAILDPDQRRPAAVPAPRNGADRLAAGLDRLDADLDGLTDDLRRLHAGEPVALEAEERWATWLERNRGALAELHAAAAAPELVLGWPYESDLADLVQAAARVVELDGWAALSERRFVDARRAVATLGRLAVALYAEPDWQSSATVVDHRRLELLRGLVSRPEVPAELLARPSELVSAGPRSLEARRVDQAARDYRDYRRLIDRVGSECSPWDAWSRANEYRHQLAETLHRHADEIELLHLPYRQWTAELERRERQRRSRGVRRSPTPEGRYQSLTARRLESLRELARIALEVRRIGAETGRYPQSLAAAGIGRERDPLGGEPWAYRHLDGGGVEISAPGTLRALGEHHGPGANRSLAERDLRRFTWELPPPGGPPPEP